MAMLREASSREHIPDVGRCFARDKWHGFSPSQSRTLRYPIGLKRGRRQLRKSEHVHEGTADVARDVARRRNQFEAIRYLSGRHVDGKTISPRQVARETGFVAWAIIIVVVQIDPEAESGLVSRSCSWIEICFTVLCVVEKDAFVLSNFQNSGLGPPLGDHYARFLEEEWANDATLLVPIEEAEDDITHDMTAGEERRA
ncbi:hypothetical protein Tco_0690396 [Tanacetum coccineum]